MPPRRKVLKASVPKASVIEGEGFISDFVDKG